jgi:hypothetical protein
VVTFQRFVADELQPLLGVRLRREALLGATPLPVERLGEPVLVDLGLRVEPRARIAVPVPRAAHVGAGLDTEHVQAHLAQAMQLAKAGDAGADHDRVEVLGLRWGEGWGCSAHGISPV